MKNPFKPNLFKIFAAAGLVAASVSVSKAQPYYVAGNYNGWSNPSATAMTDNGVVNGNHQYSYQITGQTPDSYPGGGGGNNGLKVTDGTWVNTWPANNMQLMYDSSGNATVYFYPGTITPADGWTPLANRVGYADTGAAWELAGDFTNPQWGNTVANGNNGTGSDPLAQMTLKAGSAGVYTNIYIIATPGTHNFKFRTPATWNDAAIGIDFGMNDGNAVVTTTTANQAVLFQLDLPNGRWQAGGPPAYCNVQFSVDMSLVAANDPGFNPASVTVNGDALPNGWNGAPCTNNPDAANPNVYTSSNLLIAVGTSVNYQFRYLSYGNTMYDALGGVGGVNRTVVVPNLASTNIPPVYWDDASPNDVLNEDTVVTFSVSMTNAVWYGTSTPFNPDGDYVFVNGDFLGWLTWNPDSLLSYILANNPSGSGIYTYTQTFPKGHARSLTYKYSIDGTDNEAAAYQNHFRYIRSTDGVYNLPLDTFGTQYVEPKVGGLAIGSPSGGSVPITWLSYPNVNLQSSSDLLNWLDVPNTTGASSISLPAGSNSQFFRLIQPAP
jgi:hypothetical protein